MDGPPGGPLSRSGSRDPVGGAGVGLAAPVTASGSATDTEAGPVTAELAATGAEGAGPVDPAEAASHGAGHQSARLGTLLAVLGVITFSMTFPATAWALEGLGPWSTTTIRSVLAALVAGGFLLAVRAPFPARRHWPGFAVVVAGIVIGFPLLTTLALETSSSSHAAVVVGLLPLTTAAFGALRTGARPSRLFWIAAVVGAVVVIAFALQQSGGAPSGADLYLFGALVVCAAGYTEGATLTRELPGWQVIGWALVCCLPLTLPAAAFALATEPVELTGKVVAGMVWVSMGSQFIGMYVWYRGMAAIGVARASQLQLAQPLLTLIWSVLLLGEHLTLAAPLAAVGVLVCIGVTQRAR
ncbi:DMT family transporter [Streptomyces sp. NPDC057702]|uniref:DMT family transporter n=1 Tax=unclassified Streptomyces TaxID=2593676 RepID=UPI003697DD8E